MPSSDNAQYKSRRAGLALLLLLLCLALAALLQILQCGLEQLVSLRTQRHKLQDITNLIQVVRIADSARLSNLTLVMTVAALGSSRISDREADAAGVTIGSSSADPETSFSASS